MKLWRKKKGKPEPAFIPAMLQESPEPDGNPGRGWYQMYTFDVGRPVDTKVLKQSAEEKDRLVLALINIGSCSACDLTEEMLARLRQIFAFFSGIRQEMIVRIVYDTEGKGLEREPASLEQVLTHMRQIGPLLWEFSENIHTLQGVFVGNWGEMHGSRYLSCEKLKLLAKTLWESTGGSCYLAVRTPGQRRMLEQSGIDMQKVGLFDDGLFGSETHLGTFGTKTDASKREQAWEPKQEMAYLKENCGRVPNGGETVLGERVSAGQVIQTMEDMHLTYLNRVYDDRVLSLWKQEECQRGQSLYEYVGAHLGYRFVLKEVWMKKDKRQITILLSGENRGFGNLLREAAVWLYVQQNGKDCLCRRLDADPRQWDSQKEFICSFLLPGTLAQPEDSQPYDLFLEMKKGNGEIIRFANFSAKDRVFLGSISGWKMNG